MIENSHNDFMARKKPQPNQAKTRRSNAGRPPVRREELKRIIRDSLLSMDLKPGDQLPSRPKLKEMTGISGNSVQAAIDELVNEGFLEVRLGQGTYVRDRPPHLSRYVVAYPESNQHSNYLHVFHHVAHQHWTDDHRQFLLCNDRYHISGQGELSTYQELFAAAQSGTIAGIIMPRPDSYVVNHPVWETAKVPMVTVSHVDELPLNLRTLSITLDMQELKRKALTWLAEQGCKRIGIITLSSQAYHGKELADIARSIGLDCPENMVLGTTFDHAAWGKTAVQIMMMLPDDLRPEGLFLTDDNLIGCVTEALRDFPSSKHPKIVSHANYPIMTPNPRGWHRLGFDIRELLDRAVEMIDLARTSSEVVEPITIPCRTLQEVD